MKERKRKIPGLHRDKVTGIWQVNKRGKFGLLRRSTGTRDYQEAERRFNRWVAEAEEQAIHGKRPRITFNEASAMYIERAEKVSIKDDIRDLDQLMPFIGHLFLDEIHDGSLEQFKDSLIEKGRKASTINRKIRVCSIVLNLAAKKWRTPHNKTYLESAPLLDQLPETDKKITSPLEYHEEELLFAELNETYKDLVTFAMNTGLREKSQANLRWDWEIDLSHMGYKGFLIPGEYQKNGIDFLLILNDLATEVLERWRGKHEDLVFPTKNGLVYNRFNNTAFKNARLRAGLKGKIDWHSFRSTFATRLRAANVGKEDRALLLGHVTESLTTQYSWGEISKLRGCVQLLCDEKNINKNDTLFRLDNLRKVRSKK